MFVMLKTEMFVNNRLKLCHVVCNERTRLVEIVSCAM